jgi:hypothetical protein
LERTGVLSIALGELVVGTGLGIFIHSIRLVFGQLPQAFRISGILFILPCLALLALNLVPVSALQAPSLSWQLWLIIIAFFLGTGFLCLWIAVAWHRFVLRDDLPASLVPPLLPLRTIAYLGRVLQTALIGALIGFVAAFLTAFLALPFRGSGAIVLISFALNLCVFALCFMISFRLAPLLPGAAIARPLNLGEAWTATRGANGSFTVLAVVSLLASILIDLPIYLLVTLPGVGIFLALAWLAAANWVRMMVGVSILTTIYGVYVEKRSLAH